MSDEAIRLLLQLKVETVLEFMECCVTAQFDVGVTIADGVASGGAPLTSVGGVRGNTRAFRETLCQS